MSYTRRRLLRDSALASLMAAAGSSLNLLADSRQKQKPQYGPNNPSSFTPGIRVFFIGCWIFYPDPQVNGNVLAVTLDMASVPHTFPYGVWPGDTGIGGNKSLDPNPAAVGSPRNAYPIVVQNFSTTSTNVEALFDDTSKKHSFLYFKNSNNLPINFAAPLIRVISLPIPTDIVTADFIPTSSISGSDLEFTPGPCDSLGTQCGLAAAHVFDYQGATSLSFNNVPQINAAETDFSGDFHFRTVPPSSASPGHAVDMFNNILTLITGLPSGQLALTISNPMEKALEGPYIPMSVDDIELAIPYEEAHSMNTASCAAGGFGVGGH